MSWGKNEDDGLCYANSGEENKIPSTDDPA